MIPLDTTEQEKHPWLATSNLSFNNLRIDPKVKPEEYLFESQDAARSWLQRQPNGGVIDYILPSGTRERKETVGSRQPLRNIQVHQY